MTMKDYEILSGDIVVAVWKDEHLTVQNETLLPLYLKRIPNVDSWLATRAIDSHRANSRLLKKALRLTEKDLLIANAQNIVSTNEGIVPDWVIKNGVKNIVWDDTITVDETAREVAEYFGLLE